MDASGAATLVGIWGGYEDPEAILAEPEIAKGTIRDAARAVHPDAGGTTEKFQTLQEARRILEAHHGVKL